VIGLGPDYPRKSCRQQGYEAGLPPRAFDAAAELAALPGAEELHEILTSSTKTKEQHIYIYVEREREKERKKGYYSYMDIYILWVKQCGKNITIVTDIMWVKQ
jgi:hypothetical protein